MSSIRIRVGALVAAASALALAPALADARPGGGVRASAPHSISRGGGGAHMAGRPAGGGGRASAATRPGAGGGGTRANVAGGDRTRVNAGNRINTGDVNINRNVNIDGGDWDHHGGWYDDDYHPVARGVAFGAAAAVTSAAIGSMIYSLPPSCSPYPYSGYTYYSCGGVWYQPQYQGSSVTYVVVEAPR